jgi:cytochrome oxidase Cu insertion factor (SCO1/SenC/PrrC family)
MSLSLRSRRFAWAMVLPALSAVLAASTQQVPPGQPLPDVQKLGPQVGQSVPDFTLTDQHGQPRTLASLMGRTGLMLVFFRSADW